MTELEAAVEHVLSAETILSEYTGQPIVTVQKRYLDQITHALAEANERASLLQTALAASEARRGDLDSELNAYRRAVNGKPARETIMRDAGRGPISRLLNPQQEGSRDHGR